MENHIVTDDHQNPKIILPTSDLDPPSNTSFFCPTTLTTPNGSSIVSQIPRWSQWPIPYLPKIAPYRGEISTLSHAVHPLTHATHHPKRQPDPVNRFSTNHTDRQTDRKTNTHRVWNTSRPPIRSIQRRRGLIMLNSRAR